MKIIQATGGLAHTNCFLIADEPAGQAVIFDAPDHSVFPLIQQAKDRGWDVTGLWLTHGHFDHIADHLAVTGHFPQAKVLIHRLDEPKLLAPNAAMFRLPFKIEPRKADAYVEDGQELKFGSLTVRVIFTPGHSPGHVMFYFPDQKILVGGDLIIGGAVGRTDFPDCDHAALEASVRRVMQLAPDTTLLPGHGDASTLDDELRNNPYVQAALKSAVR